jgi:hypothetical protein
MSVSKIKIDKELLKKARSMLQKLDIHPLKNL